ncbi:MAG: hypothetical protein K6E47_05785 [Lachnospiraceae bacterium]|nr:hypothetical protein [Lachnospiraceae bacterium]
MSDIRKPVKCLAEALAVFFIVITLFSSAYIIMESGHECEGEDCHICHMIEVCETIIMHTGGILITFGAFLVSGLSIILLVNSHRLSYINNTLISLKVRIND